MKYFTLFVALTISLFSAQRHFNFYELLGEREGNRLLVIGGVHGDEPGGYFAPAIITQHYKINKGSLWVVPNLNFDSIIENKRGIYGDMNRKFASIKRSDEDFAIVEDIKRIVTDKSVDFVINLHDGHGFYRNKWENAIFNPRAWGQAYIIDQKSINDVKFGNLDEITLTMSKNLNENLAKDYHSFNTKNTETKFKDEEMKTSLTFYAITHLKPALAIETSKNISELDQKVYYQLRSIEELMKLMGIEYERDFELNLDELRRIIKHYGELKINKNITIPLESVREILRFVPMKNGENHFEFSHPLGAVRKRAGGYDIMIGNIVATRLMPQHFDDSCDVDEAKIEIDGKSTKVKFGEIINPKDTFLIKAHDGIRVNVIGLITKRHNSQDEILIHKGDITPRFSIDKKANSFRAEFYKGEGFCGMITVRFGE